MFECMAENLRSHIIMLVMTFTCACNHKSSAMIRNTGLTGPNWPTLS